MNHQTKRRLYDNVVGLLEDHNLFSDANFRTDRLKNDLMNTINKSIQMDTKYDTLDVNIIIADLRGFTALAEQYSSAQMVELLNRYFHQMSEIIFSYGGTIDKFMGDSIMVLFGAPRQKPDDLSRCIACAIEMQLAMAKINFQNHRVGLPDVYMGIGINSGEVVAGQLGSSLHNEYTVIGDEVNLTSRVESHSLRGQILLSENTYQKAQRFIDVGEANEVRVKGKAQPVKMYELLGMNGPRKLKVPRREVRRSPRVAVNMPIAFNKINGKVISPKELHGTVTDISYGGLCATIDSDLSPYSEIKTSLSLSLLGHESSDIYAKVLRTNKHGDTNECHLEFTQINPDALSTLKQFVDQRLALH